MNKFFRNLGYRLEYRFCVPEFAGGILIMFSGFFFAAATNTLSGWLYVISGISFAILLLGGILPSRTIKNIEIRRLPIAPVSAGEELTIGLAIINSGKASKNLFQIQDLAPQNLILNAQSKASAVTKVVAELAPQQKISWIYNLATHTRGIFWFERVDLISASPFGLFRSRRAHAGKQISQKAVVYPQVLTLNQCPLIDLIGNAETPKIYSQRYLNANANEGFTKALRPYRWGDATRLIHWRSSAKFGELKVRELEITLSGQDLIIALDTTSGWVNDQFEEAVVAAASLYFYADGINLNARFWTGADGMVHGQQLVLETLAGISSNSKADTTLAKLPEMPVVWLTHSQASIKNLASGSRWLLWGEQFSGAPAEPTGIIIQSFVESEAEQSSSNPQQHEFQSRLAGLRAQLQAS